MTAHAPEDLEEQYEVVAGRKAPYTTIPDWITVHDDLDPQAKAVYGVLAMHVNVQRGDDAAWPTRLVIAEMLNWNREQSPDKYIKQLVAEGAIDTEDFTRPNGAKGKRYYVHQTPPPGFTGATTVAEWYKRRREALAASNSPAPKVGRPRKAAPAQETRSTPASAGKKATATKKAARTPKEQTPEELELAAKAQMGADWWWKEAKKLADAKKMKPLMGSKRQQSGYYLNLRTKIRDALDADYEPKIIWAALAELKEWSPAKREWESTLARLVGVPAPRRSGGRAPIFTNEQWTQGGDTPGAPSTGSTTPDLSDYGFEDDDVA
ncbi:hypothetical protein ACFWRZ_09245 [Streptomyces rubiginosohelvolus]|uniref:hypothetical protein n=1 Tax=Streptomyces rubiginosohelvolus TaxID=67362 RepID=UPI00366789B7